METMMEDQEFEGKDLEQALDRAAAELGIPEAELHYEIVEQGRRGLLGLGVKSVRIRVMPPLDAEPSSPIDPPAKKPKSRRRSGRKPRPERAQAGPETESKKVVTEVSQAVEKTTQQIIELIGLDLTVDASAVDDGVSLQIKGRDQKLLTSKNAELLSALHFLLNRMSRRSWPGAGRIHLGSNGKTRGRDDELIALAKEVAQQVSTSGNTRKLHPMNAYERRLIHLTVREFSGLTSSSDGDGAMKQVRISKVQNEI